MQKSRDVLMIAKRTVYSKFNHCPLPAQNILQLNPMTFIAPIFLGNRPFGTEHQSMVASGDVKVNVMIRR